MCALREHMSILPSTDASHMCTWGRRLSISSSQAHLICFIIFVLINSNALTCFDYNTQCNRRRWKTSEKELQRCSEPTKRQATTTYGTQSISIERKESKCSRGKLKNTRFQWSSPSSSFLLSLFAFLFQMNGTKSIKALPCHRTLQWVFVMHFKGDVQCIDTCTNGF